MAAKRLEDGSAHGHMMDRDGDGIISDEELETSKLIQEN